jgi:hypothetical protein
MYVLGIKCDFSSHINVDVLGLDYSYTTTKALMLIERLANADLYGIDAISSLDSQNQQLIKWLEKLVFLSHYSYRSQFKISFNINHGLSIVATRNDGSRHARQQVD